MQYEARYKAKAKLKQLTEQQLVEFRDIINNAVLRTPVGKEYNVKHFMQMIRAEYKASSLAGVNLGIGEIGYMLTEHEDIKWINCQCGGVGKFRRLYD